MNQRTGANDDATPALALDLHALKDSLTMAQRNGRACVRCGKSDYPFKPAGTLLDIQLVECDIHQWERDNAASPPVWLTKPCPAWCVEHHRGTDHSDDRRHHSASHALPLLTMDFEDFGSPNAPQYQPIELLADLDQHHLEAEPRVVLGDNIDAYTRKLTLEETQRYAMNLLDLVGTARAATPAEGAAKPGDGCRPWCARHDPGAPELCVGGDEIVPLSRQDDARVGLSHTPDDGTVIEIDGHLYMTPEEAAALVVAVVRQIHRAHQDAA